jgi:hypothetical protein
MSSGPNIPNAQRKRKPRGFTLSPELNQRLDALHLAGKNLSGIAEEALWAHPEVRLPAKKEER